MAGWSTSSDSPFLRSICTSSFSPGASGLGSPIVSLIDTTPGSLENTCWAVVSTCHSGRSPSASVEKTHSSPWREISATGPWANGPNAWRRYM